MDINTGNLINVSSAYTPVKAANVAVNSEIKPELAKEENIQQGQKDQEMSRGDIDKSMGDLNKIMQLVNADLRFTLHEETQRLIVQLVDSKDQKVLKEFPPHELLDTLAAIRNYIGVLLDKKV